MQKSVSLGNDKDGHRLSLVINQNINMNGSKASNNTKI